MSKKYLSLEEAARLLAMPTAEFNKLRERGDIRGFSDRGAWKFKQEDVEALARSRQADSNPEVPLLDDDLLSGSDSDVRLVGGPDVDLDFDSDSDVKLVGLNPAGAPGDSTDPEMLLPAGSDSDVKLVRPDSDSDVSLPGDDSDSDVKLVADPSSGDVTIIGDEEPVAIDPSAPDSGSDITLGGDSALLLGAESGITLEGPDDSGIALGDDEDEGITLALDDDSGISIDAGDSGISLETGESGISLDKGDRQRTVPMMDALEDEDVAETQFDIPSIGGKGEDSGYRLQGADDTGVIDMQEVEEEEEAVFDLDDEAASDEMDLADDAFEDEEDLDVFDADDAFDGDLEEREYVARGADRGVGGDADWGTGTFIGLTLSTVLMLVGAAVMIDLIRNTSTAASLNPVSGAVLGFLRSMVAG